MKKSTKELIIAILDSRKGQPVSGQDLASQIGVSRQAVNKAIKTLRDDGFDIVGSTKLGYTLSEKTDILNNDSVQAGLSAQAKSFFTIDCVEVTESTNNDVRALAYNGGNEGYVRIAAQQTAGKGRRGRSFDSPAMSGLYLSILLKPKMSMEDAVLITTAAAVAAAKACETLLEDKLSPKDLQDDENHISIKWVNDIYRGDRKISGILTEAGLDMETGGLDFAVMGIGFNIADPRGGWPDEIKHVAGSLFGPEAPVSARSKLASQFLNNFYEIYSKLPDVSYLEDYRSRQMVLGREVDVIEADGNKRPARAIDIDDRCHLLVKYLDDGTKACLDSGEISVRI